LCHLFNLPIEHVVQCFNSCDTNQDNRINYKEFAYHLLRPSFGRQQEQEPQTTEQVEPAQATEQVNQPTAVPAAAPMPSLPLTSLPMAAPPPAPQTRRATDPRFNSTGVSSIFGGPDGAPTPPSKTARRITKNNRNFSKTSLW
jgi:hypothetical protein